MNCMSWKNKTVVTEFQLSEISHDPGHRLFIILLFMILYMLSIVGNFIIITATNLDPQLHTPIYFFISNLSFVDLCLITVIVPKYLTNLLSMDFSISFHGCLTQLYLFIWLLSMESFLLAVMSNDRYVAICNSLYYNTVMTKKFCFLFVVASWVMPYLHCSLHMGFTLNLCFCEPNIINSFFCDHPPVLALSCSDTSLNDLVLLSEFSFVVGFIFIFILNPYTCVITSILRLHSAQKRQKAFLTCSSHLTVIALLFVTSGAMYLLPSSPTLKVNKVVASMMYALAPPMMNPYSYSLRNKDIKAALKKALRRNMFQSK